MEAIREIREVTSDGVSAEIPEAYRRQKVEIIILPVERSAESGDNGESLWPPGYFDRVIGGAPDFPDIAYEGDYEVREPPA